MACQSRPQLAGEAAKPAPKNGAKFHFALPGSVQGFRSQAGQTALDGLKVTGTGSALAIESGAGSGPRGCGDHAGLHAA
ncbi:hypothetical protein [Agrobacterium tumefaciens]|uniref:hypothetical protein n=1 Tax=Agrobacterium tumefaciens TaxID=358 RepID=UPI001F43687E